MKEIIYIKRFNKNLTLPFILHKGDWIDLRCSETTKFKAPQAGTLKTRNVNGVGERYRNVTFDSKLLPLGVGMLLPEGFEAQVLSRSGTFLGMGLMEGNSMGIIDGGEQKYGYNGPNDEWKYPAVAFRDTTIKEGERICQFRIQLSQKATVWQKLKWLFCSGVEIREIDELPGNNRRGFGEGTKDVK